MKNCLLGGKNNKVVNTNGLLHAHEGE
jgi:hypothetical protein